MIVLGCDPGLEGALALIDSDTGELVAVHDLPTIKPASKTIIDEVELARIIAAAGHIDHAFVEAVGPHKGEGAAGAFSFGRGYGTVRGILAGHFVRIHDAGPARWRRSVGLPVGATKDASRALAKSMFLRQAELFRLKKHDGRAEAVLICWHGVLTVRQAVAA